MKKAIPLQYFVFLLQNQKAFCEKELGKISKKKYEKLAFLIKKRLDVPLEQAFKMLFYFDYSLNVEFSFNVYKEEENKYLAKKPNFFRRLFRHFSMHNITVNEQKLFLDNTPIDSDLAKKILLII